MSKPDNTKNQLKDGIGLKFVHFVGEDRVKDIAVGGHEHGYDVDNTTLILNAIH